MAVVGAPSPDHMPAGILEVVVAGMDLGVVVVDVLALDDEAQALAGGEVGA